MAPVSLAPERPKARAGVYGKFIRFDIRHYTLPFQLGNFVSCHKYGFPVFAKILADSEPFTPPVLMRFGFKVLRFDRGCFSLVSGRV